MNEIDLSKKVAVVTGGIQGFGLAVVERFLRSGAEVVIWEKDKDLLDNFNIKGKIHKVQTDVSNYDSVEQSTNQTIKLDFHGLICYGRMCVKEVVNDLFCS